MHYLYRCLVFLILDDMKASLRSAHIGASSQFCN